MTVSHNRHAKRCRLALSALAMALVLAACDAPEERAETYYQRGVSTMAAGELDKAAVDLRNALKLREDYPEALLALAELEEKRGNFDAAARLYMGVAERDPQHLDSRLRLAQLLLATGRTEDAAVHAGQAVKLKPEDPRVLVLQAGIALKRGDRDGAVALATAALRSAPQDPTALMVLVSERIAASDRPGALAIIDKGIAHHPAELGLQLARLRTLEQMGEPSAVEQQHIRLTELFPGNPAFHDGLIDWYVAQGRDSEAERAARHFARQHAEDETAQIKLVQLIRRTQGAPAALAEIGSIIESFPSQDTARLAALTMARAELEGASGQPEAAVATLRKLVDSTTDQDGRRQAELRLAQTLSASGQHDQAIEASSAVLAEDTANVTALTVRAVSRLALMDNAKAIEDLVLAQSHAPGAANIALLLGEGYERIGSTALAEAQYGKALALSGYAPDAGVRLSQFLMRHGRSDAAMRVLADLRASGTADAASLSLLAQLKLNARDWAGAQELADLLRKTAKPGEAGSADQIEAAALAGMNRPDDAIDILRASLSRSPERRDLETELVRAYLSARRYADAEGLVRQRLKQAPADTRSMMLLGSVLMAAGRTADAESAFRAAAEAGASGAQPTAALAEFYLRTGRAEDAERTARDGLARHGENSALRLLMAEILEARGKFDEAIAEYERLLRSDPTSTVVANNLASLLSERSSDPKALERAFNIAVRFQNSDVPQFLDTLGWILYLRGDHNAALPLLRRAAEKLPRSGAVQFHLGMALKRAGEAELSARTLERAVTLPPLPDDYMKTAAAALEQLKSAASAN